MFALEPIVNRLDEIVTFDQLDIASLEKIIDIELAGPLQAYRRLWLPSPARPGGQALRQAGHDAVARVPAR